MDGTNSVWLPSDLVTSMARPRLTCSLSTYDGVLPGTNVRFITGMALMACTTAKPIRWVKLTLPPRERMRWLLRTLRLTSRRRAGTCRKLVAVGTASDFSMFSTMRAPAPRIGTPATWGAAASVFGGVGGGADGCGGGAT